MEVNPAVKGFILYCIGRGGKKWPSLYDEMCRVAAQRHYQGMGYSQLKKLGLALGLANVEETYQIVDAILKSGAEEKAGRVEIQVSPMPG